MSSQAHNRFGTLVAAALARRRLTQGDLAGRVGPSLAYVNATMTGRKLATARWVNTVASALEMPAPEREALHRAAARDRGYEIGGDRAT